MVKALDAVADVGGGGDRDISRQVGALELQVCTTNGSEACGVVMNSVELCDHLVWPWLWPGKGPEGVLYKGHGHACSCTCHRLLVFHCKRKTRRRWQVQLLVSTNICTAQEECGWTYLVGATDVAKDHIPIQHHLQHTVDSMRQHETMHEAAT
jgi:hypothetical protein